MIIIGTDEVGRGCIAGPIVSASFGIDTNKLAIIEFELKNLYQLELTIANKKRIERVLELISHDLQITKVNPAAKSNTRTGRVKSDIKALQHVYDSKKVTKNNRNLVLKELVKIGKFGIGVVSSIEIDNKGLQVANLNAMDKSKTNLQYWSSTGPVLYLSDFLKVKTGQRETGQSRLGLSRKTESEKIIKGDSKSFVIAAASIVAKEYRDSLMLEYHKIYPNYGFDKHVGYGTKMHIENLKKYGPTAIHRKSVKIK